MHIDNSKKVLFVGGGSAGHILLVKALVAKLLENNFPKENLFVVGGKLGMIGDKGEPIDARLYKDVGVEYELIRGGKLHRKLKFQTLILLFGIVGGFIDAFRVLKKFKPDVVVGTGGYVALPVVILAKLFGIKTLIHEQTLSFGLTNRTLSWFADTVMLGFRESANQNLKKPNWVYVGNLLRERIFWKDLPKNPTTHTKNPTTQKSFNTASENLRSQQNTGTAIENPTEAQNRNSYYTDLKELKTTSKNSNQNIIYITGGSLGSHKINQFILENLKKITERYLLVWQTGDNKLHGDFEKAEQARAENGLEKKVVVTKFVGKEIGFVYDAANLVLCRPGINTLYELSALGKRALMVPLGTSQRGDQFKNAKWYVKNFSGEILYEENLVLERFMERVEKLEQKEEVVRKEQTDTLSSILGYIF